MNNTDKEYLDSLKEEQRKLGMNNADKEYFRLLNLVLDKGRVKKNRTGVDTLGVFGAQARFDLQEGFPILTTKKVWFKGVAIELLWFLSGSTNIKYLVDNDVHIWDGNAFDNYRKKVIEPIKAQGAKNILFLDQENFIQGLKDNKLNPDVGDLGEGTYGGMWRAFPYYDNQLIDPQVSYIDQIQKVLDKLKSNPDDRRLIVSAWHPYWVDHCALPPCHCLFQFHTEELTVSERLGWWQQNLFGGMAGLPVPMMNSAEEWNKMATERFDKDNVPKRRLNCQLYQRSCDLFLGVPFNIASYALLTHLIAHCVDMVPGEFVHTFGDLHIYSSHFNQVKEQLTRSAFPLPKLLIDPTIKDLFKFQYDNISIINYLSHPSIKAEMAV